MLENQKAAKIVIINGSGGSGKDTFCAFCGKYARCEVISSITPIKEIAKSVGWNEEKDERGRRLLSDLKDAFVRYNDLPMQFVRQHIESDRHQYDIIFLMIREPEEIARAVKLFDAKTMLVRRGSAIQSNHSDRDVEQYQYDFCIDNRGSLEALDYRAKEFVDSLIHGSSAISRKPNLENADFYQIAGNICHAFHMSNYNFDLESAIKQLGGRCVPLSCSEALRHGFNPVTFRAETVIMENVGSVGSFTIYRADWYDTASLNFDVAQEFAKIILFYITPNGLSEANSKNYSLSEIDTYSSKLAAELMMPREKFVETARDAATEGGVEIHKIADQFGVSVNAAQFRGHVLGLW